MDRLPAKVVNRRLFYFLSFTSFFCVPNSRVLASSKAETICLSFFFFPLHNLTLSSKLFFLFIFPFEFFFHKTLSN